MLKKVVVMFLIISLLVVSYVSADGLVIGSDIGDVLETDIVAKINGFGIPSVNIDNRMAIYAADLRNYGFEVTWDEDKREVNISFDVKKKFSPICVTDKVYTKVGKKIEDVLYTDIKTFINGKEIQSFNVSGKTFIYFRDLQEFGTVTWDSYKKIAALEIENTLAINHYTAVPELVLLDDEIFGRADINYLTWKAVYEVVEGKLVFTQEPYYKDYVLKEELNTDINRQVYELTKMLISDKHYVKTTYVSQTNTAHVALAKSSAYAFNSSFFFHFWFYEVEPENVKDNYNYEKFSDKATIALDLSWLWWSLKEDNSLYNPLVDGWVQNFYADKLRKSFIIIFGETTGSKVYEYVVDMYVKARSGEIETKNKKFTTKIDNVQIDLPCDESSKLWFYFTITK